MFMPNIALKICWAIIISAIFLISSCALKSVNILSNANFEDSPDGQNVLTYDHSFGLVVIPMTINGKVYRFVFDTGAQTTVVSKELADDIGLKKQGSVNVSDAHGTSQKLSVSVIDKIYLGKFYYSNVGVLVNDFQNNSQFSCLKIDGILGMNVIKLNNWKINFDNNSITVFNNENISTHEYKVIPLIPSKSGIPYAYFYINGIKEKFMIDIGKNSDLISVSPKVTIENPSSLSIGYSSFGLFGKNIVDTTKYFNCSFSDSTNLKTSNVVVSQSKNKKSLVGLGFFHENYHSIIFDFKNSLLYISESKYENKQPLSYGFTPILNKNNILIGSKELNTSPNLNKLNLGDTIVGVNNIKFKENNSCELLDEILKSKKNREQITLNISHFGNISSFTFSVKNF